MLFNILQWLGAADGDSVGNRHVTGGSSESWHTMSSSQDSNELTRVKTSHLPHLGSPKETIPPNVQVPFPCWITRGPPESPKHTPFLPCRSLVKNIQSRSNGQYEKRSTWTSCRTLGLLVSSELVRPNPTATTVISVLPIPGMLPSRFI